MNAEINHSRITEVDQPEVAFEIMARKLAGLTAAIEGFAARQQELHARDYGPDLARIHERQDNVKSAILTLNERPAMQLTPDMIAAQIQAAGEQGRAANHQAWSIANRQLGNAIQSINGMVASARAAETQRLWIAGSAAAALVIGFALGTVVPTRIAHAVPESWHWPEARAASELGRDHWSAGIRLLEVADPRRLRAAVEAMQLSSDNARALADCRSRSNRAGEDVNCLLRLRSAGR
jgi:hypothetical protein